LYIIILKDVVGVEMIYGKQTYDYQEGTLVFFAPGQIVTVSRLLDYRQPKGHALVFHPDFIRGTSLGQHIHDYSFFGYASNEALHLSERERQLILQSFEKIRYELEHAIDKHRKKLILSNIELFLNYCSRFYDRQFLTREHVNKGIIERFETLLNEYLSSDKTQRIGLPTVKYCAYELNLSANYFGDLIRKETGKSAQEHIQEKVIDVAKERVLDTTKSVSEIAYALGFKYPQHFTRLFKQRVGQTPMEYRMLPN
jgi:AraC-like DNA-binding protein